MNDTVPPPGDPRIGIYASERSSSPNGVRNLSECVNPRS